MINYLFSILKYSPLNYVLAGYFQKVVSHLFTFRNDILIKYILLNKFEYIDDLLRHMNRRSISDCLFQIITSYSSEFDDIEIKWDILEKLLDSFYCIYDSEADTDESRENILDLIDSLFGNRRIYLIMTQKNKILSKIFTLAETNIDNKYGVMLIKILVKIIDNLVKDISSLNLESNSEIISLESSPVKSNKFSDINMNEDLLVLASDINIEHFKNSKNNVNALEIDFSKYLNILDLVHNSLTTIIHYFNNSNENFIPTAFNKEIKKLGLQRIHILEYIKKIFRLAFVFNNLQTSIFHILNSLTDKIFNKIIELEFFKNAINYFFIYEWNNIYQFFFQKLFSLICDKHTTEIIIEHIFNDNKFKNKILEHILQKGLSFSESFIFKGFHISLIEVCFYLNSSENILIKKYLFGKNLF